MSNVKVIAFQDGAVLRASKKEGRSIVMVGETTVRNIGGAYVSSSRRTIINLPNELATALSLKDGDDFNGKLKAQGLHEVEIIRQESTTPYYEGQEPKINPTTKEVIKDGAGNPVYMQDKAFDKGTMQDSLIAKAEVAQPAPAVAQEGLA
jgi:hypothetical protein